MIRFIEEADREEVLTTILRYWRTNGFDKTIGSLNTSVIENAISSCIVNKTAKVIWIDNRVMGLIAGTVTPFTFSGVQAYQEFICTSSFGLKGETALREAMDKDLKERGVKISIMSCIKDSAASRCRSL